MTTSVRKDCRAFTLVVGMTLLLAGIPSVLGQTSNVQTTRVRTTDNLRLQSVPNGSKLKFKGVVMGRDADTFTIRDRNRADYQVLITDKTSIKTYGGFLKGGKKYPVTDILRGLIVEVEGKGNTQGQDRKRVV